MSSAKFEHVFKYTGTHVSTANFSY